MLILSGCQANEPETSAFTEENALIIDVRSAEEFATGHIEGAINVPLPEIEDMSAYLPIYQNRSLIVYCRSGYRSSHAVISLTDMGFTNVYDLGGLLDWDGPLVSIE